MFKITCITNRKLCNISLLEQIEKIFDTGKPDRIILREKDLSEEEYEVLAKDVINLCSKYDVKCILHKYVNVALKLNHKKIHLSVEDAKKYKCDLKEFNEIGMSIHSPLQLKEAEDLGATYVHAGHIFETDCKKGIKGRGIDFLNNICEKSKIPVYAIGGINKDNLDIIKETRAAGVCIMSGFMKM